MLQALLTDYLIKSGILKTPNIIEAFYYIDRKDFVSKEYKESPYGDFPLPIGRGQTISQPTTVAFMLEILQPWVGDKVLDVGSGSGWTTVLLARIVGDSGYVWGLEIISELVEFGRNNVSKYDFKNTQILQATKMGLPEQAPFDKILVNASGQEIPQELIDQLKVGGRMIIPVRNSIWRIDKVSESELDKEEFPGFVFVPLR